MITWSDVAAKVHQDDKDKHDRLIASSSLKMQEGSLLDIQKGESFGLTEHATTQLCSRLDIPAKYYKTIAGQNNRLADQMVNHGLTMSYVESSVNTRASDELFLRLKGSKVRAVLSNRYNVFDNKDIAETVHSLTDGKFSHTIKTIAITDSSLWVKIICDDISIPDPSAPGMDLRIGFTIGNSEIGSRQVTCNPFIFRKACTNDAVLVNEHSVIQRHINTDNDLLRISLTKSMAYALNTAESKLNTVLKTREIRIETPEDVIKRLCSTNQYSKRFQDSAVLAYQVEPESTAWGVLNAFTRAAQKVEDTDKRIEIEQFAGNLMLQTDRYWTKYN